MSKSEDYVKVPRKVLQEMIERLDKIEKILRGQEIQKEKQKNE